MQVHNKGDNSSVKHQLCSLFKVAIKVLIYQIFMSHYITVTAPQFLNVTIYPQSGSFYHNIDTKILIIIIKIFVPMLWSNCGT